MMSMLDGGEYFVVDSRLGSLGDGPDGADDETRKQPPREQEHEADGDGG
ncbi:MAG: hypothetical protein IIB67_07620 [Proteobacteria bacterium]|nr:hypothetical protein [Pseudomonadota bacterium]